MASERGLGKGLGKGLGALLGDDAVQGGLVLLELAPEGLVHKVAAVGVIAVVHQQIDAGQGGDVDVDRDLLRRVSGGAHMHIEFSVFHSKAFFV